MTLKFIVLAIAGLALHVGVGFAIGRSLAYLKRPDIGLRSTSKWIVYGLSAVLLVVYGQLAGFLSDAMSGYGAVLIMFVLIMLGVCRVTYIQQRE